MLTLLLQAAACCCSYSVAAAVSGGDGPGGHKDQPESTQPGIVLQQSAPAPQPPRIIPAVHVEQPVAVQPALPSVAPEPPPDPAVALELRREREAAVREAREAEANRLGQVVRARDEQDAGFHMRIARQLLKDAGNPANKKEAAPLRVRAAARLQIVVDKYPETDAAREAKALLGDD